MSWRPQLEHFLAFFYTYQELFTIGPFLLYVKVYLPPIFIVIRLCPLHVDESQVKKGG